MRNQVTKLIRGNKWIELMRYFLQDPLRVVEIHSTKIGWVLNNIKNQVIAQSDQSLTDEYYQLRREVTRNHPNSLFFKDENPDNQWLELIHLRDWSGLRDYLLAYPDHFWSKLSDEKRFIYLSKIRSEVYNIARHERHSDEYIEFRQQLMNHSPEGIEFRE